MKVDSVKENKKSKSEYANNGKMDAHLTTDNYVNNTGRN